MKTLFAFLFLLSTSVMASMDTLNFKILPGPLHIGGKASAQILSADDVKNVMVVKFQYEIVKRPLVPVPNEYLKGFLEQELPGEFVDERGYLNLEALHTMDVPDAILYHMGRVTLGQYKNAHRVRIKAKNGHSETDIFYHPQLPELGWGKVSLRMFTPIPLLEDYTIEAQLK